MDINDQIEFIISESSKDKERYSEVLSSLISYRSIVNQKEDFKNQLRQALNNDLSLSYILSLVDSFV